MGKIKIPEKDKDRIITLYNSNVKSSEIAKIYNVDRHSISNFLKRHQVPIYNQSDASRKYRLNEDFFKVIDTQEKAYFLGFLYADGSVLESGTVKLSLKYSDKDILDKLSNLIYLDKRPLDEYIGKTTFGPVHQSILIIHSKKIYHSLVLLGCTPRKTFTLEYPLLNDSMYRHFIRGYLDGDGCIYTSNKSYHCGFLSSTKFIMSSKEFIEKILDIKCNVYKHYTTEEIKELRISGRLQSIKFLDWIYEDATIYLQRKYDKYQEMFPKLNLLC